MIKNRIESLLKDSIKKAQTNKGLILFDIPKINLEHPENNQFGDYSSNIAMQLVKFIHKNPFEIAQIIKDNIDKSDAIEKVEVVKPGFINFYLSKIFLIDQLKVINKMGVNFGKNNLGEGKTYMLEFAHPNTHKEFHIGHLKNILTGEAVAKILEAGGYKIIRANYQGDVGMHIAKCLYIVKDLKLESKTLKTINEKIEFLGKSYTEGNKAYESDEKAKKEIIELNKKIYARDKSILALWQETRSWSLEYFDKIYEQVNTKYDRFYFESEVWQRGLEIVKENLDKGIFEKSEGAVIFDGEKHNLHKRVFITKEGTPTYEAKDMALAELQFEEYNPDKIIHVVGPEQSEYFRVIFKALEQISKELSDKEKYLPYGWVQLKHGKMSSRKGQVVRGLWLIEEVEKKIKEIVEKSDKIKIKQAEVIKKIALGAIKYSFLRLSLNQNISFDINESVSFEGESGPYLQYSIVRIKSILEKSKVENLPEVENVEYLEKSEEIKLLRKLYIFPEIIEEAGKLYEPHLIASYIYELSQDFNSFYGNVRILQEKDDNIKMARFSLIKAVAQVIENGLKLLGIETVEKM